MDKQVSVVNTYYKSPVAVTKYRLVSMEVRDEAKRQKEQEEREQREERRKERKTVKKEWPGPEKLRM